MPSPYSLQLVKLPTLRAQLARRLPFYYGWVVFAIAASTSYAARPLMSVAVLSVFMVPMTEAFGWSRGLFAGAVSLGGLCGVIISPIVGRLLDKYGSGWMLSATSAVAAMCAVGLLWSFLTQHLPVRAVLALSGLAVASGAVGTALSSGLAGGSISAGIIGGGVGGLHLLLPLAWADYYGRQHLGIIRGITLPAQIGGQAVGPVTAGFVFDAAGNYHIVFIVFACVVTLGSLLVLAAVPPSGSGRPLAHEAGGIHGE